MKAKRTRIAPNIYRYPDGHHEVILSAAGRQAPPTRFPAETPIAQMERWISDARKKLKKEARDLGEAEPKTRTGTLRTAAPDYVAQIGGRAGTAADTSHLRAWFEIIIDGVTLGDLPLRAWTTAHVNKAIAQWQTAPSPHAIRRVRIASFSRSPRGDGARSRGRARAELQPIAAHERSAPATSGRIVSALTIRHRCRVLRDFFRTHDDEQPTPVDKAKVPARHKRPPVTLPPDVVQAVLERLATIDPPTFGRFYVHATTGQRPCQVGRARPEDLQLRQAPAVWLVRDAKGEHAHSILLNATQVAAWEAFIAAEAWGAFSTSDYGNRIHQAGWPHGVRPYAARHSLARVALKRGASLNDITALFGHTDQNTTRRSYAPFQIEEQQNISARLSTYLADVLKPRLVGGKKRGKP